MHQVELSQRAKNDLKKADLKYKARILLALSGLRNNPYSGKKLDGEYQDYFAIRVWPYRIIYQVFKNELLVIVIR